MRSGFFLSLDRLPLPLHSLFTNTFPRGHGSALKVNEQTVAALCSSLPLLWILRLDLQTLIFFGGGGIIYSHLIRP